MSKKTFTLENDVMSYTLEVEFADSDEAREFEENCISDDPFFPSMISRVAECIEDMHPLPCYSSFHPLNEDVTGLVGQSHLSDLVKVTLLKYKRFLPSWGTFKIKEESCSKQA